MGKRIAVIGAGAVGGYAGAHMAAAGHDVTLIDPWPEHVEQLKSHGMEIFGMTPQERMSVKVNAMHITEAQTLAKQKPIDIAFVAVKSYDTVWATTMIRQYLSASGCVVSMQNCINEERVAGVVGWGRTLGCIVTGGVGVDLYQPGHIRRGYAKRADITSFYVGEPSGRITRRVAGDRRDHVEHRCREADRQSLGGALDEAVCQRHAQRCIRRDRHGRQRAGSA